MVNLSLRKKKIFFERTLSSLLAHLGKHRRFFGFLKVAMLHPGTTGAVIPSSKRLARTMASYIMAADNELVVELGPGTGVITQAILDHGIAPQQIIAIEYNLQLAKSLQKRFPNITVIQGNAADLKELLSQQTKPIRTIISGLPLRSLPKKIVGDIVAAIPEVLSEQGQFIQFTYDIRKNDCFYPTSYQPKKSTIVWRNIPPAKVEEYTFNFS